MTLFNYNFPVPCYQTEEITSYSSQLLRESMALFQLARVRVPPDSAGVHCIQCKGSFSIKATNTDETSAKMVMYQRGVGRWLRDDPVWSDGVYIWVRTNGHCGEGFEMAARDPKFNHRWVLRRFIPNLAVSVAPNPNEHFYYFKMEADDNRTQIAELLAFCSTL